jgi:hypothetical protein
LRSFHYYEEFRRAQAAFEGLKRREQRLKSRIERIYTENGVDKTEVVKRAQEL